MKPNTLILFLCFHLLFITACKKNTDTNQPSYVGVPTDKGTPVGTPVSKSIDSQGGSLSSADGRITIIIPAGAVTTATNISIQPVTNKVTNGIGLAYSLLPEGLTFSKDVTVKFSYTDNDLNGGRPEVTFIAYQSVDGIWHAKTNTVIDKNNHTAITSTNHFSTWAILESFVLQVDKNIIGTNEIANLKVVQIDDLLTSLNDPSGEIPIGGSSSNNDLKWTLIGQGGLASSGYSAIYTAPSTLPSTSMVTVSVEISNIATNLGTHTKMILIAQIKVVDTYLSMKIKGQEFNFSNSVGSYNVDHTVILSGDANGSITISISGYGNGSYPFGDFNVHGKVDITVSVGSDSYIVRYQDCISQQPKFTSGTVGINNYGAVSQFIEGDFSGNLVNNNTISDCSPDIQKITGHFRAKRIQ